MKQKIIITGLLITSCFIYAQKWEQYIGMSNRNEGANDIIESYDKGINLSAIYVDDSGHAWSVKSDANGNVLYDITFEHNLYNVEILAVDYDENGNLYISGVIIIDDAWPLVIKLNACGEKEWCKAFIDPHFDQGTGWDILVKDNNEILVLANQDMEDHIDQAVLYCLNSDGDVLWQNIYASKNDHPLIDNLAVYNLYNYNNSYFIDGYCYYAYPDNPFHFYLRPFFIKVDSLFNEEWILPFGITDTIIGKAYGILPLNDSVYFGLGERRSSATYNKNSLLMYFDKDGNEIGYNQIPNSDFDDNVEFNTMWEIVRATDSTFITKYYIGKNDTVFHGETLIDTSGNLLKITDKIPGNGIAEIIRTSDNNFLEAIEVDEAKGYDIWLFKFDKNLESVPFDTNTYVYDSLCPHPIQSYTADISNCVIWTYLEDIPTPQEYYASIQQIPVTAYPNPAKDRITFGFENTKHHSNIQLQCFNLLGKKVHEERIFTGQEETQVNLAGWPEGMYVAVVVSDGKVVGKVKFVVL